MPGRWFDSIIFGPVKSRRLGTSLGINLLPPRIKFCSFNCIYCECGWTTASDVASADFIAAGEINNALEKQLIFLKDSAIDLDSITFAGNGEPTMHPEFPEIVDNTISLRNTYAPDARITTLSNSTMLYDDRVVNALMKINNIMKLDAGSEETFRAINNPKINISLGNIVENLKKFKGNLIVQSMFIRGSIGKHIIDNTTEAEIDMWLEHIKAINPKEVMLYSIDRRPPVAVLEKISQSELQAIADRVKPIISNVNIY